MRQNDFRFETPENVQVSYEVAGLGTRFVAWLVDQLALWLLLFLLLVVLLMSGISFDFVFSDGRNGREDGDRTIYYFFGLFALLWGLGSFVYFGCCELLLRGQTIGKRISDIRVVKADGFQLDAASILVRNVFRVVDHLPPMWIFPVMSRRAQRTGDMVAGTLVVVDSTTVLSPVRHVLAERSSTEALFRFDQGILNRLTPTDFQAIESVLDRFSSLKEDQQAALLDTYTRQVAKKLRIDLPAVNDQMQFLEDLFAAELRRRDRTLV